VSSGIIVVNVCFNAKLAMCGNVNGNKCAGFAVL